MATNKMKAVTKADQKSKNYVYSWLKPGEGEGYSDFVISDNLSSLNFEVGTDTTTASYELKNITLNDGNTSSSYLRTVAAGYINLKDSSTSMTYAAPLSLSVLGVDTGAIYGGAVISNTNSYWYGTYTNAASRYQGVDAIVNGVANITVAASKTTTVYGGGAGYGSVLEGVTDDKTGVKTAVNMKLTSTNRIGTVYGGGQKGAVVNGDVNITVSRDDATVGGRISTIYGGGDNAVVDGNVYITIEGTNAVTVGTISGSGKGSRARVTGERTLEIADYSGKFTSNIKDFDTIKISGHSSVVLTQTQNRSIQSAVYEFVLDNEALSVGQKSAMLTWNKNVDLGQMVITIDGDLENVENGFAKTIYASSYATADIIDNILVRTLKDDGTYAYSSTATSVYTLEFVADKDSKGNAKAKGGYVVLNYTGSNTILDASSNEDVVLSEADEKISIKPSEDSSIVRASIKTLGGDDQVTVQKGTTMAGDIALGTGNNTLRVQGNSAVSGSVIVDKNSKNDIYLSGAISQIEGGDSSTENTVYINTPNAVGYYQKKGDVYGERWAGSDLDITIDPEGDRADFVAQDLNFSNDSSDKVVVSNASGYAGNINFAKGKDTLVLNSDIAGTITAEDGNDMIVANKTGVGIDASRLKLSGTDNVFVASNGVYADVNNAGAIGDFEAKYAGLYLSQNAMINVDNTVATMSYAGNIDLSKIGDNSGAAAEFVILPVAEQLERVSEYYTAGDGVKGNINANGINITFREGAKMDGTIWQDDTLVVGANYQNTVRFMGTAGGNIYFNNDVAKTWLQVDKDAVATVGSINGLNGETYTLQDSFDRDVARINWAGRDAAVYENDTKNLIVGRATKDIADFAKQYGVAETAQITVDGLMEGKVTFTDANAYTTANAEFGGDVNFVGKNTVNVKTVGLVFDDTQMKFAEGATTEFNVLDGGVLIFDGIKAGESYQKNISVTFEENARFAYGDTMYTKTWTNEFTANELYAKGASNGQSKVRDNVTFVEGATVYEGIDLTKGARAEDLGDVNVTIEDNVTVMGQLGNDEDFGVIKLGKGNDKLTIGKATVNGQINAGNKGDAGTDEIVLKGTMVNTMVSQTEDNRKMAIKLGNTDTLDMSDKALVNGYIDGGKHVQIKDSEVTGSIAATTNVLVGAKVGAIAGGTTLVETASENEKTVSEIGTIDVSEKTVKLYADAAVAKIGAINGLKEDESYSVKKANDGKYNAVEVEARNGATVEFADGIESVVGNDTKFTAYHNGSEIKFNGDVKLVTKQNVTMSAKAGGELTGMGDITISGGVDMANDPVGTMDKVLKDLKGTLQAAGTVTIESSTTDVTGLEAEVDADKKTVSNLTAGDVNLVATNSSITMASEGSVNTFGEIRQSGAIKQSGYPLAGTDAIQQVTVFENANEATVEVTEVSSFKADSITQYANTAKVAFNGTAEVTNGIVQGAADNNKLGIAPAPAGKAEVTFNGASTTLTTASISQYAGTSAKVDANVTVENKYNGTEKFAEANDAVVAGTVNSIISGTITQEASVNTVNGKVTVNADGTYATGTGAVNNDKHKAAVITADAVKASYGVIDQTGNTNTVTAGLDIKANGESDVTINGASEIALAAITQTDADLDGFGTAVANKVDVSLKVQAGNDGNAEQSKLTLKGNVTGTVGAVKQVAYNNANVATFSTYRYDELEDVTNRDAIEEGKAYGQIDDKDVTIALTVASVEMAAYNGSNDLDLSGNVTVTGDVTVGGVLEGEKYVDYAWGDRTATLNTVEIDVDTVSIGGNLALIGLKNQLTLKNDEMEKTGLKVNAKNVYIAGSDNTVDIAYGVEIGNVELYALEDYDKFGQEGYELGTGNYKNTFIVRGTLGDGTNGYMTNQEKASDNLLVYGGTIKGDVDTKNGNDFIELGYDGRTNKAGDEVVMGDSKIEGNVVMGVKGSASGTNAIMMRTFDTEDSNEENIKAYDVGITGNVEMYSGKVYAEGGDTAASNDLRMTGNYYVDENGYVIKDKGTATIGGYVKMDAVSFDADGNVEKDSSNNLEMGNVSKISGDVSMSAYESNYVDIWANEQVVLGDANVNGYAEITGKASMSANQNTIELHSTGLELEGTEKKYTWVWDAAAYVNGISMDQVYTDADGKTQYITSISGTGNESKNVIEVGKKGNMDGAQLIVGTAEAADKRAAVTMGTLEYTKADAADANYVLDSIKAAERGHDVISFIDSQAAVVKAITDENTIDVVGRFTSADVSMLADENTISLQGDGDLGYTSRYKAVYADDSTKTILVDDKVRTAVFTAGDINQTAVTSNEIWAEGWDNVKHRELDENGKSYVTKELESAQFTSGKITQTGLALDKDDASSNAVVLKGSIVANTGAIEQTGNGSGTDDFTNQIWVNGIATQVVDNDDKIAYDSYVQKSTIGGDIKQIATRATDANEYWDNAIELDLTDVKGSVSQTAASGNRLSMNLNGAATQMVTYFNADKDQTGKAYKAVNSATVEGGVEQTGAFNTVTVEDTTVKGAVKQVATRGTYEDEKLYGSKANEFFASSTKTRVETLVTGDDEICPAGERAATETDGLSHNDETILVQGSYNRQSIGSISQVFDNSADVDAKHHEYAQNMIELLNTNVGSVSQGVTEDATVNTGYVKNSFVLDVTDDGQPKAHTKQGVEKAWEYTSEIDDGKDVKSVAIYNDIEAVTAGDIAQKGTINEVSLNSANTGAIKQESVQFTTDNGVNAVFFSNEDAVEEQYVKTMKLDEGNHEVQELVKVEGSVNKFVKTTTGDITQTSNAQKNYESIDRVVNAVSNLDRVGFGNDPKNLEKVSVNSLDGINTVSDRIAGGEMPKMTYFSSVDVGAINQGLAAGAEAKFANVSNVVVLGASKNEKADIRLQEDKEKTYTETVLSSVKGGIKQEGADNTAAVVGTISGDVSQKANMLATYGHNGQLTGQKVSAGYAVDQVMDSIDPAMKLMIEGAAKKYGLSVSATNVFAVTGTEDFLQKNVNGEVKNEDGEIIREGAYDKGLVGDVAQKVDTTTETVDERFLDQVAGNNVAAIVNSDFGNVEQETVYGVNATAVLGVYGDKTFNAETKKFETTMSAVANGKSITQVGKGNIAAVSAAVLSDDKKTEAVEGIITQTANAADAKTVVTANPKKVDYTKEISYNIAGTIAGDYKIMGKDVNINGGASIIGGITQTMNNVEYKTVTKTYVDKELTKLDDGEDAVVEAKETSSTNGSNIAVGVGGYVASVVEKAKDEEGKVVEADPKNPDYFENGSFVGTIGDVTQTLTSYAKSADPTKSNVFGELSTLLGLTGDKEIKLELANKGENLNQVILEDTNAGAIKQEATGYAVNAITSDAFAIKEKGADYKDYYKQYKYEGGADGYKAVADTDAEAALKTTIASIKQEGLINQVDLKYADVGNIDIKATLIEIVRPGTEEEGGPEITVKEYISGGDGKIHAPKTVAEYANTVTLTNVEADSVKAISDISNVIIGSTTKEAVISAAKLDITDTKITGKTEDGVVKAITTGAGNDVITLDSKDGVKDSIVGTIDMGTFNGDNDVLNINSKDIDLTQATIKNVEKLNVKDGTTLEAASIQAVDVTFAGTGASIKAKTLDISGFIDHDPGTIQLYADTVSLGNVDYAQINAYDDKSTKIKVSLNGQLKGSQLVGTSGTNDSVTFGADSQIVSVNNTITDFEDVEINKGATLNNDIVWKRSATTGSIDFDFNGYENAKGKKDKFTETVGDLGNYYNASNKTWSVTFEDGVYTNAGVDAKFYKNGVVTTSDYYEYDFSNKSVTYVA